MQLRHLASLVLVLSGSAHVTAQTSVFLPPGSAAAEGPTTNLFPWGRNALSIRFQNVYDSTNFTAQGINQPILITGARWRANASTANWTGTTYSNVEVFCSTSALDYLALSSTWALNRGTDFTRVVNGAVSFLGGVGNGGGVPGPNVVLLSFATPFLYDPSSGNDFLCEVTYPAGSNSGGTTTACDAWSGGSILASRVFNTSNPAAATGTIGLNHALTLELVHVPASGIFPSFAATPRSGDAPLAVSFADRTYTSDPLGVQQWAWDLDGNGTTDSTVPNPSFTYSAEGYYDVTLRVTDTIHAAASRTETSFIAVDAVEASFTTAQVTATRMRFLDTSLGHPTSWQWDFENDGVVDSTVQSPVHTYPFPGTYRVRLVVADAISSDVQTVNLVVSVLPIPAFGRTNTVTNITGGFYFQAPLRFSIISAQVPDESGHGLQNVAIYRLAGAPPAFSATASGGLELFRAGQPSATPIPCSLSFSAGEWVGVLGACGDASTMRSSEANAAGSFATSLFGSPVTLTRMLTQTNLVTAGGTAPYSSESAAEMGRIALGISRATGIAYGAGTPSGSGSPAPILSTTRLPRLGTTAELTIVQQDPTAFGFLSLSLGRGFFPLPLGTLLIDVFTLQFTLMVNLGAPLNVGATSFQIAVPNDPVLNGAGPVTWQNINLVPGSPNQVSLSNGQEWFAGF